MESTEYIRAYIDRSRNTLKELESWDQLQIDEAVRLIGRVVYDNAAELAQMAVEETGMGNVPDKTVKNKGKSSVIWNSLKGRTSRGVISRDERTGIVEIAKPVGVIAAVTPCTNPVVTPMCNAMFAVKGGNSIIFTPHHRSFHTSTRTVELINKALAGIGAPEHLIQIIGEQSRENTRELMASSDVVIATGGMGMVRAAYSSGKPAFGVGSGNVQCIIDRDAEFSEAVPKIITGRCFDNGIICSSEQTVIVHNDDYDEVMDEFRKNGCYTAASGAETEALRRALFPDGKMNPALVGQPASKAAAVAGVAGADNAKILLIEAEGAGRADLLSREKMCPVLSVYRYNHFDEAVEIAAANLDYEGAGHSVAIHSCSSDNIEKAALRLNAGRFVINQTSSTSAGGSFYNGFTPTTTLGCGSWGNNSISENLSYKHLINVSRIGNYMPDNHVPDESELWGEE
ncbi:MAG: aldehyde dehydrogenase family protein [Spirochaetales bacterium]|uniref:Aldehyde dehydrogenase family protein n=1 Tax=Candidatus Thalassospirochaeta sargassi TaxID=3119039 RepID=A0AAJ1IE34_9SPIO|nr:aldehyde dehydrogenase family protein [Spirochaetales bacterium]